MPFFIKTEQFNEKARKIDIKMKRDLINEHKQWVSNLSLLGHIIYSGYLINYKKEPGGGGLMILKAESFSMAKKVIETDPMILSGLVSWQLNEWIYVSGKNLF